MHYLTKPNQGRASPSKEGGESSVLAKRELSGPRIRTLLRSQMYLNPTKLPRAERSFHHRTRRRERLYDRSANAQQTLSPCRILCLGRLVYNAKSKKGNGLRRSEQKANKKRTHQANKKRTHQPNQPNQPTNQPTRIPFIPFWGCRRRSNLQPRSLGGSYPSLRNGFTPSQTFDANPKAYGLRRGDRKPQCGCSSA
jgi:hypothetical protein